MTLKSLRARVVFPWHRSRGVRIVISLAKAKPSFGTVESTAADAWLRLERQLVFPDDGFEDCLNLQLLIREDIAVLTL